MLLFGIDNKEKKGMNGMLCTSLKRLAVISCFTFLTACGGDSDDLQSPVGGSGSSGGSGNTASGSGGDTTSVVKIGSGTGSSFVQGILSASNTNLTAGSSTDIVVNLVDDTNTAISEEVQVNFTSDCFANGLASFDAVSAPTVSGRASVTYTAAGCSGTDTVVATAQMGGSTLQASVDLSIAPDQVLALNFESAEPDQLALKGMGSGESSRVTFTLVGAQGSPIRNELVTFSLNTTAGGVSIAPDVDGDPVRETVTSDNNGLVSVVVRSGTVATTVRVTAEHNSTGIQGTSQDLVISSGVPVASKFSVTWRPHAPAGAVFTDGIPVQISIIASDQFGNDAFDGTRISFWSPESGNVDSSCVLESGRCTATWISSSPRTADRRATVIAYTNGAEDFGDADGDNVFDAGESWTDLSEAYADHNENGAYDSGEFFVDGTDTTSSRGSVGAWDSAFDLPAAWDGPCLSDHCPGVSAIAIWDNIVIATPTGIPSLYEFSGTFPNAANCTTPPVREPLSVPPGSTIDLIGGTVTLPAFYVSDSTNRNSLPCHILGNSMPTGTTVVFSTDNGQILSNSSWTIDDPGTRARLIGPLQIKPDDTSSDGVLTLTITPPSESNTPPAKYTWDVTD